MLKDIINSIFHSSNERLKNPFVSSFIISVLILNWKAILILIFSDSKIDRKINFISNQYLTTNSTIIYPLLFALFYVIILPYIMQGISYLVKYAKTSQIEAFYEEEILKSNKRAELVRSEVKLERIKANSQELSDLNETINSLKNSNSEKDVLLKELRKDYEMINIEHERLLNKDVRENSSNIPMGINDDEFKYISNNKKIVETLTSIAQANNYGQNFSINKRNSSETIPINYLFNNHLIKITSESDELIEVELTNKGRVFWNRIEKQNKLN